MSQNGDTFESYLQRFAVPAALVLALSANLSRVAETYQKYGTVLFMASATILSLIWCYFVFGQRRESQIDPTYSEPKYSVRARVGSVALVIISILPLAFILWPQDPYRLPSPSLLVVNESGEDLLLEPQPEFYISIPITPLSHSQVGIGKLELQGHANSTDPIAIPSGQNNDYAATFASAAAYRHLFEGNDAEILFVWRNRADGTMLKAGPIPFNKTWLLGEQIVFQNKKQVGG